MGVQKIFDIQMSVEWWDAEEAKKVIGISEFNNRRTRKGTVMRYAELMRAGAWKTNPEPIVITKDGDLIQGQHRCLAIIEADAVVPMCVVRDWPDSEAFDVMDTGAVRRLGDVLGMRDVANHTAIAAIAAAVCHGLRARKLNSTWASVRNASTAGHVRRDEVERFAMENLDMLQACQSAARKVRVSKLMPSFTETAVAAATALICIEGGNDLEIPIRWFVELAEGQIGSADDSRWLLLRWGGSKDKKVNTQHMAALIIKAWNMHVRGASSKHLVWKEVEQMPFPLHLQDSTDEEE